MDEVPEMAWIRLIASARGAPLHDFFKPEQHCFKTTSEMAMARAGIR
ncbi:MULTISPECIES: hypothetical protein [Pseudoxanthomonas]|jgi:hypothetical protein|nr:MULTISPECIES: hypothetical protein [Pseudoxanthomonas]MBB3278038.1 hypothetical protein [Pseudoxanthomonas sp. OG2]MBV7474706.1 hypothetical protein [Pseudoxanthomonas sp. PXM05]UBB25749.1 hypothetical protein LAG73_01265 [Pseudoxanthomonas japonensis]